MIVLNTVIFVYSLFSVCNAAFVDSLKKCSYRDDECLRSLHQGIISQYAKSGIPELGIERLDPFHLQTVTIPVANVITFAVTNGIVKGISKCTFDSFRLDVEKQLGSYEMTCSLIFKGDIALSSASPQIKAILGDAFVDAHGKGKVKLDKLHFKYDAPYVSYKKDDGEIYLKIESKGIKYDYTIENASLTAKNFIVANNDISPIVSTYFNENWKTLFTTFGETFLTISMEVYFDTANKFFAAIPAKNYIEEDLSPYVKN